MHDQRDLLTGVCCSTGGVNVAAQEEVIVLAVEIATEGGSG
jgi:hypothetical protein